MSQSFLSRPGTTRSPAQPAVRGFYGNRSLPTRTPPGRPSAARSNRTHGTVARSSYQPNDGLFSLPPVAITGYHEEEDLAEANGDDLFYDGPPSSQVPQSLESAVVQEPNQMIRPSLSDVLDALQAQQALLQKVLKQQEAAEKKQKDLEMSVNVLTEEVQLIKEAGSPTEKQQRKTKVPRDLTNKVSLIHESLEENGFNPEESSLSTHNKSVKDKMTDELIKTPDLKYSEDQVKTAVKRKYEAVRRQWLDEEKEDQHEIASQRMKKKKYASRLQRKFERRGVVVLEAEKKYWKQLSVDYMSDESDGEDSNTFVIHPLSWRSEKLMSFIGKLDDRYEGKLRKDNVMMARKVRKIGEISNRQQPTNAPKWTVKQHAGGEEVQAEMQTEPFTMD